MSSHREAPSISKDPNADNTDVYAFLNPNNPNKVVLIANYIPFEIPYGGPNFAEFADDVVYAIHVSNKGTADPDVTFQFRFSTKILDKKTFLYNTGPIGAAPQYTGWNRPQTYKVTRVVRNGSKTTSTVLASGLAVPPVNVGARSTPNYNDTFTEDAVHDIGHGRDVFAGQRADAFKVDLGSIFDLGGIRTLNEAHELKLGNMPGVNGLSGLNVHTIAIQLPISQLSRNGTVPTDPESPASCIGVWASASRARSQVYNPETGVREPMGGYIQVSRLGNPLFNEVINPMAEKDYWNAMQPRHDSKYAKYVATPELAQLLPTLYPGAFPNLDAFNKSGKPRIDLEAVLLTGVPSGIIDGFSTATGGSALADMLRLNLAIAPKAPGDTGYSKYGVLGQDLSGFPNGRRVDDDVTAIELRAIAGATLPLVDPGYTPDAPVATLTDDSENAYYTNPQVPSGKDHLGKFPFMPPPNSGYATTPPIGSTGGTSGVQGAPDNGS